MLLKQHLYNTLHARESQARPETLLRFVGLKVILGALGLMLPLASAISPWLTPLAALGLVIIQLLAIFTVHIP